MKVHFVGIGGIGVSALAQYYLSKGQEVFGSDLVSSEITDFLKNKGIKIFIGKHKAKNLQKDVDLVVYSPAVKKDNPELKHAKKYKIRAISYPEALGELTKEYYTIAIAGAHGKTTTTAMLALVLERAGLDPTVIVGTKVKEFGNSNFRAGKSPDGEAIADPRLRRDKILIIEACEYDSSFLYYAPKIVVVTNVDKEHLDYFKTFAKVKKAFADFIARLPEDGFLVFNADDKEIPKTENPKFKALGYSLSQPEAKKIKKLMKIPGSHNVLNALAALRVARILEIPDEITFKSLSEFKGTWRRFEITGKKIKGEKITLISDYAHHPNEILATLNAVREKYSKKTIWCVFQPHQYQRTFYLFNDFVKVFQQAPVDKIIITDIYDVAGRETKKTRKQVSSQKLVERIGRDNILYLPSDKAEKYVKENIKSGDVLIIMGAGDIYKLADQF
ncbi:MAG: UDP-N-acetylmuramate--L-alanine ligase [bacterium]